MNKVEQRKQLVDNLFELLEHADFSNGNTSQGMDEGDVMAHRIIEKLKKERDALYSQPQEPHKVVCPDLVEDGFGTAAPAICPTCGLRTVYVCRPGDIRCGVCYDNNPKEWYNGTKCTECGMNAVHNGICQSCKVPESLASTEMSLKNEDWESINKTTGYDIIEMIIDYSHNRITAPKLTELINERCEATAKAQLLKCQSIIAKTERQKIGKILRKELLDNKMTSGNRFFRIQEVVTNLEQGHEPVREE